MLMRTLLLLVLIAPLLAYAETAKLSYTPPAPIFSTENMLQMVSSLFLVLIVIGALAWLLKRFGVNSATSSSAIKVIATNSVGQRERVVLIEIENTRLVLGVAPGRVNLLHRLDKSSEVNDNLSELKSSGFPGQLDQSMKKTHD